MELRVQLNHSMLPVAAKHGSAMLNENYMAMTDGVKNFLLSHGLEQYYDIFIVKGYDSEEDLLNITERDLDEMYINDESHRKVILGNAHKQNKSPEYLLYEWLRSNGLDYYLIGFIQSELTDFSEIAQLNLPDEDMYDELEITLPGHKRRLERAVQKLRKRRRDLCDAETPIAYGRWTKPQCLSDAKYDFLCIDATISSTKPDQPRGLQLEFMVDSGSDVVTVREEILRNLDLELIGPVQSRGVHASRRKFLYRAKMAIGNEELEIEVMSESYDSIGSRVIRHFRHYISGNKHIWLKGDFRDSLPKENRTNPQKALPPVPQESNTQVPEPASHEKDIRVLNDDFRVEDSKQHLPEESVSSVTEVEEIVTPDHMETSSTSR